MADKWPLAAGNWSNAANWNGGTLPLPGDDVYCDNRIVVIDQNIDVGTIRTTQRAGGTAGGSVTASSAAYSIVATTVIAGTTAVINVTAATGTVSITANLVGSATGTGQAVSHIGFCNVSVLGNITGGSFGITAYGFFANASTGNLTVVGNVQSGIAMGIVMGIGTGDFHLTGNVTGGSGVSGMNTTNTSPRNFTIIGNANGPNGFAQTGLAAHIINISSVVAASGGVTGYGAYTNLLAGGSFTCASVTSGVQNAINLNGSGGTINLTGTFTGGTTHCVTCAMTNGSITLNGNVTGSSTTVAAYGFNSSGATDLVVNGNVSIGLTYGLSAAASGNLTVNGDVIGGPTYAGLSAGGTLAPRIFTFNGTVFGPNGATVGSGHAHTITVNQVNAGTGVAIGAAFTAVCVSPGTGLISAVVPSAQMILSVTGTADWTVNGNIASTLAAGLTFGNTAGTMTINGNVTGGTGASNCWGISHASNGTLIVNGDVYGGPAGGISAAGGNTGVYNSSQYGITIVNGDVYGVQGNATGQNAGIYNGSTGTIRVTGRAVAGLNNTAISHGVNNVTTGAVTIGEVVGNNYPNDSLTQASTFGLNNSSVAAINVRVGAITYGTGGWPPIAGRFYIDPALTNFIKMYETSAGVQHTFADVPSEYPAAANVRLGTVYDFGALTGTLAVPPVQAVGLGVPVDATTGTAAFTQAAISDAIGPLVAAFGS